MINLVLILAICIVIEFGVIVRLKTKNDVLKKTLKTWKKGAKEMNQRWKESAERIAEMTKKIEKLDKYYNWEILR
jgi:predicted Holliday junction resolvase-like endonuclease